MDWGGGPISDMAWAGVLFNGFGRAMPLDYSSVPGSGAAAATWGPPAGNYYKLDVVEGEGRQGGVKWNPIEGNADS